MYDYHYDAVRVIPLDLPLLTTAQKFSLTELALTDDFDGLTTITDLTLPTELNGVSIAWASDNAAIDAATGVVTRPASGAADAVVTLTATLSITGETDVDVTVTVTVTAEPASPDTVADAQTAADGDAVYFTGVVTSVLPDGTFTVEDPDGTALYVDDYSATFTWGDLTVAVGDEVILTAVKSHFNGYYSIDTVSAVEVISSGNAITDPIVVSDPATFRDTVTPDMFGKRYSFNITVGVDDAGYYIYFYNDGSNQERLGIVADYSYVGISDDIVDGDVLVFTATLYGTNGSYTDVSKIFRFAVTQASDLEVNPTT
jgi:hypothetical protein